MYLTVRQQLKHLSKSDYENLRELSHTAKNLMNEALYINRRYFFTERKYPGYDKIYKAINQCYNKEHARLASIKDKQHFGDKPTFRQNELARKRKRLINDYISKACRIVINYCLLHNIGKLVCGYNVTFQHNSDIGRVYSIYASFTELNIMSRKRAIRV